MQKIIITGTTGSGKTTMGKALSKKLGIPYYDLDDLYWLPNWEKRKREDFLAKIEEIASHPTWIICGNQTKAHHLFWPKADTVIWLDPPFIVLLYRIVKRSILQAISKELICNGNRQTFKQFIQLLGWLFSSYRKRKKRNALLKETEKNLQWVHLKSGKKTELFLSFE